MATFADVATSPTWRRRFRRLIAPDFRPFGNVATLADVATLANVATFGDVATTARV